MNSRQYYFLISIVLTIGLFLSGNLVYREVVFGNICPKIGNLPACYVIFFYFIVLSIIHLSKKATTLYFLFAGFALSLATFATIGQLIGMLECPKTASGFPLCYLAFVIFLGLVALKFLEVKLEKK